MQTRLFRIIRQLLFNFTSQLRSFNNIFTISLFSLFAGYISGSAFATFLPLIRIEQVQQFLPIIISFILIAFEIINSYVYSKSITIYRFINTYKIGILLGFFIDAFKVGS